MCRRSSTAAVKSFVSIVKGIIQFILLILVVMAKSNPWRGKTVKKCSTMLLLLSMLSVLFLVLTSFGIFSLLVGMEDDDWPPNDLLSYRRMAVDSTGDVLEEETKRWTEILSWEPRAFVYHNFLSKDECKYLITLAKPYMKKSSVIDNQTGRSTDSRVRTSTGMFLKRGQYEMIKTIERRIADFTFIPAENGEGLQILHYAVGEKYEPHFDYFVDEFNSKHGGQRVATLLMYLSDVDEGGETVFPSAKSNNNSDPLWNRSDCAKQGLSFKPKMGSALLFWNLRPDATADPSSLHGSFPVIKGNKWSATKWMHLAEF